MLQTYSYCSNHQNYEILYICTEEACQEQTRTVCAKCLELHLHQKHCLIEYEKYYKLDQSKISNELTQQSQELSITSSQFELLQLEDKQYQQQEYVEQLQYNRNIELNQVLIDKLQQKAIDKYKQYDNDTALNIIQKALKLNQNNIKSLEILYDILKNKQSYFEAINICSTIISKLKGDNKLIAEWFAKRSSVTRYSGNKTSAQVDLETAIKLDPTNDEYKQKLDNLQNNNNKINAEHIFHKIDTYLSIFNDNK